MSSITLTTVIQNSAELLPLLQVTDLLVSEGLIDSLQVVDQTGSDVGSAMLRNLVAVDALTSSKIVVVDLEHIVKNDSGAYIATGVSGYHHMATGINFKVSETKLTIAVRGGAHIALTKSGRGSTGYEIVLDKECCFIRRGRGGGSILSKIKTPGIVAGNEGWKTVTLTWNYENQLVIKLDTGEKMIVDIPISSDKLDVYNVTVSSLVGGTSDIVITKLRHYELAPAKNGNRYYASYMTEFPTLVNGDVEILFLKDKIFYVNLTGCINLIENGTPVIINNERSTNVLEYKRNDIIKSFVSDSIQSSLFNQSLRTILSRIKTLQNVDNEKNVAYNDSSLLLVNIKDNQFQEHGEPMLFAVLSKNMNVEITDDFLSKIVDIIPAQKRKKLVELISKLI